MKKHDRPYPPSVGALLRLAWQEHRDRLYERVSASGFRDVTKAQFNLLRWPSIDGLRPGEIAESLLLSKQTVNDLLGEMERGGYLERHVDPGDRRARVVRLTPRGQKLMGTAAEASRELEEAWVAIIGRRRFETLREALDEIVERGLPREDGDQPAQRRQAAAGGR